MCLPIRNNVYSAGQMTNQYNCNYTSITIQLQFLRFSKNVDKVNVGEMKKLILKEFFLINLRNYVKCGSVVWSSAGTV